MFVIALRQQTSSHVAKFTKKVVQSRGLVSWKLQGTCLENRSYEKIGNLYVAPITAFLGLLTTFVYLTSSGFGPIIENQGKM